MAFSYEVLTGKTQRISLVKFKRAVLYPPQLNYPEIDDRGYFREETAHPAFGQIVPLGFDRGPIVGVTEDDTIFVTLKRERIDDQAALFVTSSDTSVMTVSTPTKKISSNAYSKPSDKLQNWNEQELQITGIKGGGGVLPKVAKVEIRYGSNRGAIIGELTVYVFSVFYLNIVPHLVNLSGSDGRSFSYIFDVKAALDLVQAVWQPCGIKFLVGATENESMRSNINQSGKWKLMYPEKIFDQAARHHKDAVNIYFVDEIVSDGGAIAYATLPGARNKRGIVAQTDTPVLKDLAITLAHELGHFLNLPHIDKRESRYKREDLWSKDRLLMHPSGGFLDENCLIAMKDLVDKNNPDINHITDPEWLTVRKHINSKDGPYK